MILEDIVLFPQMMLPLYIFESRYRALLKESLDGSRMFCVARKRLDSEEECPERVAGIGIVRVALDHDNGTSHLVLQGIARVLLKSLGQYRSFPHYEIRPIQTLVENEERVHALSARVKHIAQSILNRESDSGDCLSAVMTSGDGSSHSQDQSAAKAKILDYLKYLEDPEQLGDLVASSLVRSPSRKQTLLATNRLEDRLDLLAKALIEENNLK